MHFKINRSLRESLLKHSRKFRFALFGIGIVNIVYKLIAYIAKAL